MATTQQAIGHILLDVQLHMGHSTLIMTNHYASLSVEHLKGSHDAHSPLRALPGEKIRVSVRDIGRKRITSSVGF